MMTSNVKFSVILKSTDEKGNVLETRLGPVYINLLNRIIDDMGNEIYAYKAPYRWTAERGKGLLFGSKKHNEAFLQKYGIHLNEFKHNQVVFVKRLEK